MTSMEIFVWAMIGGVIVTAISASAVLYQKEFPSNKQLSRDFLIGAAFTGFLYPLIPETFDEVRGAVTSAAGDFTETISTKLTVSDPGVKIGPANF